MATAIRKHLHDFIAVAALIVVAVAITGYILEEQRIRIPVFEEKPKGAPFTNVIAAVRGEK